MLPFLLIIMGLAAFCVWQNNSIVATRSEYASPKIPKEFDGCVIAHISDLHSKEFGGNQKRLLEKLNGISPDIIVITGDLIDRRNFHLNRSMDFVRGAVRTAPVYYVPGNHEAWSRRYPEIRKSLLRAGVRVLDDAAVRLSAGAGSIRILGLKDPAFLTSGHAGGTDNSQMEKHLRQWASGQEFRILLSHRPELFSLYAQNHMDLIFSGHAHGGQFRLPFAGGLIAPGQGLFPRYTSGRYEKNGSAMFVSRGLGNSIIPMRIFNRPEIGVVTLKSSRREEMKRIRNGVRRRSQAEETDARLPRPVGGTGLLTFPLRAVMV